MGAGSEVLCEPFWDHCALFAGHLYPAQSCDQTTSAGGEIGHRYHDAYNISGVERPLTSVPQSQASQAKDQLPSG